MVPITILQLTSTDLGNESLAAPIGSPEVGDLVAIGARTKRFQVVAVYPYYQYSDHDIRIAVSPLSHWRSSVWLSELESLLLRATEPPYNAQIPMES